jgi:hypothetical protein
VPLERRIRLLGVRVGSLSKAGAAMSDAPSAPLAAGPTLFD